MGANGYPLVAILGMAGMVIGVVPFWVPAIALILVLITGIGGKS